MIRRNVDKIGVEDVEDVEDDEHVTRRRGERRRRKTVDHVLKEED